MRKMFAAANIDRRTMDPVSASDLQDDLGGQIRADLIEPPISRRFLPRFTGGVFVGCAADLLSGYKSGPTLALLDQPSVPYHERLELDPYCLLARWLHPRRSR